MMVGSVRGKQTLWMPLRVAQSGRWVGLAASVLVLVADGREAQSVGGQVRFVPALMLRVGWPHWAQKGLRAFQSRRARDWA